ncbi:GNAT family N-acetyltransferase [Natronomonas gomsonensis]|uniref:GNAT family N-acetyltransferase n=1 Tax=Natronomonas gomsonensis TaxID=1046043 RepID=UPI0020CA5BC5|nr:GNAT family N-acetyltransferase [Natronomonas gomsonensis]MCY4729494.1 GNAT family N-acetyltransferase [Natronomonas gomsonensis]
MRVEEATPGAETAVRAICNAAMLELDEAVLAEAAVLVAREDDRVLGALVLNGTEIDAVAVRPGRRGSGIGSALVEAAADQRPELTAEFDLGVRPFYESLGFDIDCDGGRCRGYLR